MGLVGWRCDGDTLQDVSTIVAYNVAVYESGERVFLHNQLTQVTTTMEASGMCRSAYIRSNSPRHSYGCIQRKAASPETDTSLPMGRRLGLRDIAMPSCQDTATVPPFSPLYNGDDEGRSSTTSPSHMRPQIWAGSVELWMEM
jgi:hypothetical protein